MLKINKTRYLWSHGIYIWMRKIRHTRSEDHKIHFASTSSAGLWCLMLRACLPVLIYLFSTHFPLLVSKNKFFFLFSHHTILLSKTRFLKSSFISNHLYNVILLCLLVKLKESVRKLPGWPWTLPYVKVSTIPLSYTANLLLFFTVPFWTLKHSSPNTL